MKGYMQIACFIVAAATCVSVSADNHVSTLNDLLKQVRITNEMGSVSNREREQMFIKHRDERRKLFDEANHRLEQLINESERLEEEFNRNEIKSAELETLYRQKVGHFGDLSNIFHRAVADLEAQFIDSVVALNIDNWQETFSQMRKTTSLPTVEQLDRLFLLFLELMSMQAVNVRFDSDVVSPTGDTQRRRVVRMGAFAVTDGGDFLSYSPSHSSSADQQGRLFQLARRPASRYVDAAESFAQAESGIVAAPIDPSRGSVLSLLVRLPTLIERIKQGGGIGYLILLIGAIGLFLGGERLWVLSMMQRAVNRQSLNTSNLKDNPLGRVLAACSTEHINKNDDYETLELKVDDAVMKEISPLEKGLGTMKVLAAVAPLLGLLGTVTGMIETFQAITLFGSGDPKLMAGGISQALVTTALGLIVAVPILLLHTLASARSRVIREILEEQSAGLLVQHFENRRS